MRATAPRALQPSPPDSGGGLRTAADSGVRKLRAARRPSSAVAICALIAVGAALRLLCAIEYPFVHADEYHQYLNSAWWWLTGTGVEAWEWRDGARSWLFPAYHGAWMSVLLGLGVDSGATLTWFFRLHWALVNSSLAYVAWRGAAALTRQLDASRKLPAGASGAWIGGSIAAIACTLLAPLLIYSSHTLTELPSMLLLVWGLVSTHTLIHRTPPQHERERAILTGLALSLAICLRIANGPLAVIAPLWLLLARRRRALASLVAAAILPVLIFALVDWATWGSFARSFVVYVKFNLIEGRSADFGVEPPQWYLTLLFARAPWTLLPLVTLGLLGLRATWPFMLSAALALGYLSAVGHKEERFILIVWPLFLIAAAATLGHLVSRLRARAPRWTDRLSIGFALAFTSAIVLDAFLHREPPDLEAREIMACERWTGDRHDLRGLVLASPWWHGGGALWLGARVPTVTFSPSALHNPLFNYAIVPGNGRIERASAQAGYRIVFSAGRYRVRKRD